jgi:predicted nuclease of predicted toxin-antitoxin system
VSLKFIIDENLSWRIAKSLQKLGIDAVHIKEVGLQGKEDDMIMQYAIKENRVLLTQDSDFADIRNYPPGTHKGIIRFKIKFAPSDVVVECFKKIITHIDSKILTAGAIVITDCKKYRIREP